MDIEALRRNFSCIRCGNSCRLRVKITSQDIKRILKAPYVRKEGMDAIAFSEPDLFDPSTGKDALKMAEGACVFLGKEKGTYSCRIYDHRPEICRAYPFVDGTALPCSALKTIDAMRKR